MDRQDLGWDDADPGEWLEHPIAGENGDRRVADVLDLAAAAGSEVAAGGGHMVGTAGQDGAIRPDEVAGNGTSDKATILGDSVAFCAHSNDLFSFLYVGHVTEAGCARSVTRICVV